MSSCCCLRLIWTLISVTIFILAYAAKITGWFLSTIITFLTNWFTCSFILSQCWVILIFITSCAVIIRSSLLACRIISMTICSILVTLSFLPITILISSRSIQISTLFSFDLTSIRITCLRVILSFSTLIVSSLSHFISLVCSFDLFDLVHFLAFSSIIL